MNTYVPTRIFTSLQKNHYAKPSTDHICSILKKVAIRCLRFIETERDKDNNK